MPKCYLADSLGFVALPGAVPRANPELSANLLHLTSAPPAPWTNSMSDVWNAHKEFLHAIASQEKFEIIQTRGDLKPSPKTKVVFGLQSLPPDADIAMLYMLGIRIVGLAYDTVNSFGGGFIEPNARLTDEGKKLLRQCQKAGMIVDLSHVGHTTARDVFDYIVRAGLKDLKIMASHSGCYDVYPHLRNIPDDIIDGITTCGGVIGIPTLTFVLDGRSEDLEPFIYHLQHAVLIAGPKNVCIGTDGVHSRLDIEKWKAHSEDMKAKLDQNGQFQARWPDQPLELNCANRLEVIANTMRQASFSEVEVENIVGLNFLEFLRSGLK